MTGKSYRIPTVLSGEELKDKAFRRASKISLNGTNALDGKKKSILAKITASGDLVKDTFDGYVNKFPVFEKEEDFLPELLDLIIGIDKYKKSLGAMKWAANKTEKLKNDSLRDARRAKDIKVLESIKSSFYGRLASIIDRVSKELKFLQDCKQKFRSLPAIESDVPTVVVAGFPNVGKSSLVTHLSTAAPEIAPYPFTTKGIVIGHIEDGWRKYQIIDTPGLLDREFSERNDIEKQATLALKYLTHVIVFVMDPSETCGYSMEKQEKLLISVKKGFPGVPLVILENKCDILQRNETEAIPFSAETGDNIENVKKAILKELRKIKLREDE